VLTINALQRFNLWDDARAAEAQAMIDQCAASGAKALILCPVNDVDYAPSASERRSELLKALNGLKPMLSSANVRGFVEPLGFAECSLRLKEEAVDAIEAVGGSDVFRIVHDTFHHFVAGETKMFPKMTGLVHISGVADPLATAATSTRSASRACRCERPHRQRRSAARLARGRLRRTGLVRTFRRFGA